MTTRNIVPRATGEGKLGTTTKKWNEVNVETITADSANVSGTITADSANVSGTITADSANVSGTITADSVNVSGEIFASNLGAIQYATPNLYACDKHFYSTEKIYINSPVLLKVNINNTECILQTQKVLNINEEQSWDDSTYITAANRKGKDFYIYACKSDDSITPSFILSANSTVPTNYTADNSRKVGGFHCLCADVGEIEGHKLSGYTAGDIIPNSVWDLSHRPKSEPEGMAYVDGIDLWVDIYLSSWTGSYNNSPEDLKLVSKYNAVCADGTSSEKFHCYKFEQVFGRQKKRLLYQREFVCASIGSNQGKNVSGSADVNTTGGFKDTAGRRMISDFGLEDCCGNLYQWGADVGRTDGGNWANAYDTNDKYVKGQCHFGEVKRVLLGGIAGDGSHCGSRCSAWASGALTLSWSCSCRGASEPSSKSY